MIKSRPTIDRDANTHTSAFRKRFCDDEKSESKLIFQFSIFFWFRFGPHRNWRSYAGGECVGETGRSNVKSESRLLIFSKIDLIWFKFERDNLTRIRRRWRWIQRREKFTRGRLHSYGYLLLFYLMKQSIITKTTQTHTHKNILLQQSHKNRHTKKQIKYSKLVRLQFLHHYHYRVFHGLWERTHDIWYGG